MNERKWTVAGGITAVVVLVPAAYIFLGSNVPEVTSEHYWLQWQGFDWQAIATGSVMKGLELVEYVFT